MKKVDDKEEEPDEGVRKDKKVSVEKMDKRVGKDTPGSVNNTEKRVRKVDQEGKTGDTVDYKQDHTYFMDDDKDEKVESGGRANKDTMDNETTDKEVHKEYQTKIFIKLQDRRLGAQGLEWAQRPEGRWREV